MYYYIDVIKTKQNNAAKKAPVDIARICDGMGLQALKMPAIPYEKSMLYQKIWMLTVWTPNLLKIKRKLKKNDVLLIQHPLYGTQLLTKILPEIKNKGVRLIAVIHDLNIIRGAAEISMETVSSSVGLQDKVILKMFDKVICHNDKMADFLINSGFDKDKLISLEIFDYLYDKKSVEDVNGVKDEKCTFVIAGNLLPEKSKYIYALANEMCNMPDCRLYLYGGGYDESLIQQGNNENVIYKGSVSPDELPELLCYDYGIIWDGLSIETCTGHTGEYLRFNNPHKTSLYLASGMPVIVWNESAMADFVKRNNIGIVVDSLKELETVIKNISEEDYKVMKTNVAVISENLKKGYYFRKAFNEAVKTNEI